MVSFIVIASTIFIQCEKHEMANSDKLDCQRLSLAKKTLISFYSRKLEIKDVKPL